MELPNSRCSRINKEKEIHDYLPGNWKYGVFFSGWNKKKYRELGWSRDRARERSRKRKKSNLMCDLEVTHHTFRGQANEYTSLFTSHRSSVAFQWIIYLIPCHIVSRDDSKMHLAISRWHFFFKDNNSIYKRSNLYHIWVIPTQKYRKI
jgi:hypothetical protein